MRALSVLIALIGMGLLSFSQTLKPQILINQGDTLLGFNYEQSKTLAKAITKAQASDSIANGYEIALSNCDSLNSLKTSQIKNLDLLLKNANEQTSLKQEEINLRINQADQLKKELKGQKVQKWIAYSLCIVFGILAIK
jgi:hypothetical protein